MKINNIEIDKSMSLKQLEILFFGAENETNRRKIRALLEQNGENPDDYSKLHNRKPKKYCEHCGKELKNQQRKFCSHSCSAAVSNKNRGNTLKVCKNCGKIFTSTQTSRKFCSRDCAARFKETITYNKIINGDADIMRSSYAPTRVVYKYIIEEQSHSCAICKMKDTWNGKPIKFIVDHIDGDASNNKRSNLRCICPNCDSQLDTYKNTKNHRSTRTKRTHK